jgi:hypothetical protein
MRESRVRSARWRFVAPVLAVAARAGGGDASPSVATITAGSKLVELRVS